MGESPGWSQSPGNTHSMCHISRAAGGRSVPVLCCGNGTGLAAREGSARCAATQHFSLSRLQSTSLSVLSSGMQPDEKFRGFCASKWSQESLSTKDGSGIFPLGYGCAWLHAAEVVWEEAQSAVLHISFLPSAHFRQIQASPALPTPPSLELFPKSCWPLAQRTPNVSHELNYSKYWHAPNPTKNYFHRNHYRQFPFLLEQHSTAEHGHSCFWWEMCLLGMLVLSNSPVLKLGHAGPQTWFGEEGLFGWVFFLLQSLSSLRKVFPTLNLLWKMPQ